MRAIHADPQRWSKLAGDRKKLEAEIQKQIDRGLFYLRYTTGDPAKNMWAKGIQIVADYVQRFAGELNDLTFEPEKAFETLIEYPDKDGGALVSGAIDIVRRDDPPRVTLIDFKSGDPESDKHMKLDEEEMKLQVAIYALAAKKELEGLLANQLSFAACLGKPEIVNFRAPREFFETATGAGPSCCVSRHSARTGAGSVIPNS